MYLQYVDKDKESSFLLHGSQCAKTEHRVCLLPTNIHLEHENQKRAVISILKKTNLKLYINSFRIINTIM